MAAIELAAEKLYNITEEGFTIGFIRELENGKFTAGEIFFEEEGPLYETITEPQDTKEAALEKYMEYYNKFCR